jgi:hypothetical protein
MKYLNLNNIKVLILIASMKKQIQLQPTPWLNLFLTIINSEYFELTYFL